MHFTDIDPEQDHRGAERGWEDRRVRDARKEEVGHGPVSVGGGDRSEWTPKGRKGGLPQPHQA